MTSCGSARNSRRTCDEASRNGRRSRSGAASRRERSSACPARSSSPPSSWRVASNSQPPTRVGRAAATFRNVLAGDSNVSPVAILARARMATGETFESPASTLRNVAAALPTRVGGWLFEATRQLDGGEELRAGQALERSLRLAAPERLRRPFREASSQVRRLLRADPQLVIEHGWLGASALDDARPLVQARRDTEPDPGGARSVSSALLEPLTEKEREV